ncbi:MAG TPA: GGDEF domain-containing protein [Abditibacterium sp.]
METQNEIRDGLTGLLTPKDGLGKLEMAVRNCAEVALVFVDIDYFKTYNEFFGHGSGDEKLVEIAREIENGSGENALVFRYGGDEFGVIFYESPLENARQIAEKIRAARKPVFVTSSGKEVATLTLSLGIAHFPTHVSNAENLLAAAYLALLKAKGEGKEGGRWPDGTPYSARNRVMAIGDFLDDFPEQSARFLK